MPFKSSIITFDFILIFAFLQFTAAQIGPYYSSNVDYLPLM